MRSILLLLLLLVSFKSYTFSNEKIGQVTGLAIPRFVTLKSKDVNMRSGPGINYPVKINYKCYKLPVKVLSESENWRLVKDSRGNEGWVHEAMIDQKHYIEIINDTKVPIFRLPSDRSKQVAYVEQGVIANFIKCNENWCNVIISKTYKGWINKKYIWGFNSTFK
jgi:SH3-like domain-containing protein